MSVYFIKEKPTGYIKIGFADSGESVLARLAALQTGNPRLLEIVGIIGDASISMEGELHRQFKDDWVRGEWFRPSYALLNFIRDNTIKPEIAIVASARRKDRSEVMTGSQLERAFTLDNWLSILTFDAFKYAAVGGEMEARWTDDGLTLVLVGITSDHAGLNAKFRKMMERGEKEKAVQP